MTCRFCSLHQKLMQQRDRVEIKPWQDQITVQDEDGRRQDLKLTGHLWLFPDGSKEIVRLLTEDTLFVNSLNPYPEYKDIIIGFHAAHLGNRELFQTPDVLRKLFADAQDIIDRDYGPKVGARIMFNSGKYASVLQHSHIQIIQVFGTRTLIPAIRQRVYKRE